MFCEQVVLLVKIINVVGEFVFVELVFLVVNDMVVSFVDDKKGYFMSMLLFEKEVFGKIEEFKFYFDFCKKKSVCVMDLFMGICGWCVFEWCPVFELLLLVCLVIGFGRIDRCGVGGLGFKGVGCGGGGCVV